MKTNPDAMKTNRMKPFRSVLVKCTECKCENRCRMQADDGEHNWECNNCMEKTIHTVQPDHELDDEEQP